MDRELQGSAAVRATHGDNSIKALNAAAIITKEIVADGIKCLKVLWTESAARPHLSDDEMFDALCARVQASAHQTHFIGAVELFLRDHMLKRTNGNMAEASRRLYERPGNALSNATSSFIKEGKAIEEFCVIPRANMHAWPRWHNPVEERLSARMRQRL